MKKKLFVIKAGLGNQIQQTHIYLDLVDYYGGVDIAVYEESKELSVYFKQIAEWTGNRCMWFYYKKGKPIFWNDSKYDGVISCLNVPYEGIPVLYQSAGTHVGNEIDWYERIYHHLPLKKGNHLPLNWQNIRGDDMPENIPAYDALICNGSVNKFNWIRKRYQNWDKVAQKLNDGLWRVGCVGLGNEYVYPADDLTGQGLLRTMDMISKCKLLLSNDTGLYHFASAIGIPCIVVFTATSIEKNYNPDFHKKTIVFHPELECFPCQEKTWGQGKNWTACANWNCSEFKPNLLIKCAEKILAGKRWKHRINSVKACRIKHAPIFKVKDNISKSKRSELTIETMISIKRGEQPKTWKYIPDNLIDRMWYEDNLYVVKMKNGRCWKWPREAVRG